MSIGYFTKLSQRSLILFVTVLTLNYCSVYTTQFSTYQNLNVTLNSYSANQTAVNKPVVLLVCNDANIQKNDLRNLELESYIKRSLLLKGYTFTDNERDANIVVFYEYGVSDPRVYTYERIEPIWGVTGIASSVTTTARQRNPNTGRSLTLQYTYNTPSYGQIGERIVTESHTRYLCWANLSAYDADYYRRTGEDKMLWLTEIQSENQSDNLRVILPYMIAAAKEHIGQNRNRINVNISTDPVDPRLLELLGTLVIVQLDETATGKDGQRASVYQDVYRNGELIIRAGTYVKMAQTTRRPADKLPPEGRNLPSLELFNFSTTTVYGKNIPLKGEYLFTGEWREGMGIIGALLSPLIIGIPLLCNAQKRPHVPIGTLLFLEMQ